MLVLRKSAVPSVDEHNAASIWFRPIGPALMTSLQQDLKVDTSSAEKMRTLPERLLGGMLSDVILEDSSI